MATTNQAKIADLTPSKWDICISRGDNRIIPVSIKDSAGAAIDISGRTYTLTVDPSATPTDNTNNLFQLTGTFATDGTDGIINFQPTEANMDQTPGTYFYDIEQVNGTIKSTIAKGKFVIQQDITK